MSSLPTPPTPPASAPPPPPVAAPQLKLEPATSLRDKLEELEEKSRAQALAVAVSDLETGLDFRYRSDRWFHPASTIKLAVLLGVFAAIHRGKYVPQSRLHVRNRFRSAYDGSSFQVLLERDADSEVQAAGV
jgi:beta-lactamase class A